MKRNTPYITDTPYFYSYYFYFSSGLPGVR